MYRKRLIQRLQQLVDSLPIGAKRKSIKEDLLALKLSKTDYHYITLRDKYEE